METDSKAERTISPEDFKKAFQDFVNDWPLYSPVTLQFSPPLERRLGTPTTILRGCENCEDTTTWQRQGAVIASSQNRPTDLVAGSVTSYRCSNCNKRRITLWIYDAYADPVARRAEDGSEEMYIERLTLQKFGQVPPPDIAIPSGVKNALSEEALSHYKKAMISLSQGYGIAAATYFRRVVEDTVGTVLDLVAAAAEEGGDEEQLADIKKARQQRNTADKLKIAAEALPRSLRHGNQNPLSVLFDQLSRGLHGLSDADCVLVAKRIKFSLDYVFKSWRATINEAKRFRQEMAALADPESAPEEEP